MAHTDTDARSHWDPEQYHRFNRERAEAFHDLLSGVEPIPGGYAVDLGCGTGDLTRRLHEFTNASSTIGIDNSPTMLAQSQSVGGLTFQEIDISAFTPAQPLDLVFSNAALQWLPQHEILIAGISKWLKPGGQMAVQVPANQHHISHTLAANIAQQQFDCPARRPSVLTAEAYSILLDRLGFEHHAVRVQIYLHHLPGPEALVEWVEGTLLKAYRSRMDEPTFEAFNREYREALLDTLPRERPYRLTFPRILMHAKMPCDERHGSDI